MAHAAHLGPCKPEDEAKAAELVGLNQINT